MIRRPESASVEIPELPEGTLELLKETAFQAGRVLEGYRGHVKVEFKGEIDLVTEADRKAESVIVDLIRENYPEHGILAEESGSLGPDREESDWQWVIDPLDGTTNFSHGLPIFATSIALQYRAVTAAGCVYAPALDEFYFASHGSGASLNGEPVHVSDIDSLKRSLVVTGFPYDRIDRVDHYMEIFGKVLKRTQGVLRWGSAAIDLCHVASGRLEAFWEEKLHPWDTAAGELIVREAGGRVTRFGGEPYSIFDPEILASNGRIHGALSEILQSYSSLDESSPVNHP